MTPKYQIMSSGCMLLNGVALALAHFNKSWAFIVALLLMLIGNIGIAVSNFIDGGNCIKEIYHIGGK